MIGQSDRDPYNRPRKEHMDRTHDDTLIHTQATEYRPHGEQSAADAQPRNVTTQLSYLQELTAMLDKMTG